ncbi:MAG: hypothetical protein J5741_05595 [Bacteroidales bacterium]|nr:hypothetical protein [Bacteroidales bacterium]
MFQFISDTSHYTTVLDLAMSAKRSLWIGTADIKDLYVLQGKTEKPFLGILAELLGKGVEARLIHAKEPGPNFRADFDRYPRLAKMLGRVPGSDSVIIRLRMFQQNYCSVPETYTPICYLCRRFETCNYDRFCRH